MSDDFVARLKDSARASHTVSRMAEQAEELIAGMEAARGILAVGVAPEPDLVREAMRRGAEAGVDVTFIQSLDDTGQVQWTLRVSTGRGTIERRPELDENWCYVVNAVLPT